MESAGIPELAADAALVHVGPANVNSGSRATSGNTEEGEGVRVCGRLLRSVDALEHKASVEQAARNSVENFMRLVYWR